MKTLDHPYVRKSSVAASAALILICFAVVNQHWSYGPLENIPVLTSVDLANRQNRGRTFRLEGTAAYLFRTRNDLLILNIKSTDETLSIQATAWPSLGEVPRVRRGDVVEIVGTLGKYRGKWQLNPLSGEHIRIIDNEDYSLAVPLSASLNRMDEFFLIGPVKAVSASPFVSATSGKTHLKFSVSDAGIQVEGIMFEGNWDEGDLALFRESKPLYLKARVVTFQGKPSLQAVRVTAE